MPVIEVESVERFDRKLGSSKYKHILVDFYADWCGPCKRIAPEIEKMSNTSKYEGILFMKVSVDKVPEISDRYKITSLPTFLTFNQGEKEPVGRSSGASVKNVEGLLGSLSPVKPSNDF